MNMQERRLTVALPSGEYRDEMLNSMGQLGLRLDMKPRRLIVPVGNMPIDFVLMRASSIPGLLANPNSSLVAGITGSDILWETGSGPHTGEEFPLFQLNPSVQQARLYVGLTERFNELIKTTFSRSAQIKDLTGSRIATMMPKIAKEVFEGRGVTGVTYQYVHGADESLQYIFEDCNGILGIINTGTTLRANHLIVLEIIHEVVMRLVQNDEKMTSYDHNILDDLREKIELSLLKQKSL